MKKREIKWLITVYLVDEELVPEEDVEEQLPDNVALELKRLEFQEKEKAREAELRMKELEIREKESENERTAHQGQEIPLNPRLQRDQSCLT